jgi:hypothetical protein
MLLVKTKGEMDVPSANAMVKAVADAAVETQCFVHLIDHREMTFAFSLMDYYDRPHINENWASRAGSKPPWSSKQLTKDTRFMETVFQNRGYNLRHFTDIEEAKAWLNA